MSITKEKKQSLIEEFRINPKDTGSSPVQVSILTEHILNLSEHMKKNPKDFSSRMGLLQMVSQRRQLLDYLKKIDADKYQKLIQRLDLRK